MAAQKATFKGFGLICLAWAVSERKASGESNKFRYVAHEHTKMGEELIYEINIGKFRTQVGRSGDKNVGMTGLRWFIFRGNEWLELDDETDYNNYVELWESR